MDFEVGLCVRAADGFAVSGDAAVVRAVGGTLVLAIVDVLGHGPTAHEVAAVAEDLLEGSEARDVTALMSMLDAELGATVGAAVGLAAVDAATGTGVYAGIGNTVARILGRSERRLVSIDGVVGKRHASVRPAGFTLAHGESLLLHTDGISSRVAVSDYPGVLTDRIDDAARELVRRFGRDHDDAACIMARRVP